MLIRKRKCFLTLATRAGYLGVVDINKQGIGDTQVMKPNALYKYLPKQELKQVFIPLINIVEILFKSCGIVRLKVRFEDGKTTI